ncbi:uncharacterized protein BO80DRAFT_480584 [Aspergillus ibericus CBS 121593]|uniref:RNase III domain-containing protein n=1 Tax=Aspergillus ibericus CBS 121593 TaxID=1448316 RepID=A0A395GRI3_9EURO|nr:hypothetical protein BO80DRAFT_480584 [Aspergillus ibericus CBS 121593]RAK98155.1 hypothetical protein BO80DRAFT_480584 [Aspergillus ibericus CBS 121593]
MASKAQVEMVEKIIDYRFASKDYLHQALTAARGEGEDRDDGNRALAQIGAHWFDTLLMILLMRMGASKEDKANLRIEFTRKDHFTFAAKRTGISQCIKYSSKPGSESSTVLRYAINAIIGAVLLDTASHTIGTTLGVITRYVYADNDYTMIDPTFDSLSDLMPSITETDQIPPNLATSVHHLSDAQLICDDPFVNLSMFDSQMSTDGLSIIPDYAGVMTAESSLSYSTDDPIIQTLPRQDSPAVSSLVLCSPRLPRATIAPESNHLQGSLKKRDEQAKSSANTSIPDSTLREFLNKERMKCSAQHLPPPEETYFTPEIHNALRSPTHESIKPLLPLLITMGSPDAIVSLRGMICNIRAQPSCHSCRLQDGLSPARRYSLIEQLEHSASTMQLMKWYHIYELFRECGGPDTVSSSGYANSTPASFPIGQKCLGNPVHHGDANVSKTMMKDIFPDMDPSTDEYKKQFRRIQKLRKLGQRLHALIDKFGKGILGLMVGRSSSGGFDIPVSDTMLFKPTEGAFACFISLLESSQGDSLRAFGDAVWGVLRPALFGTLSGDVFDIERLDPEYILRQVKGSPGLLGIIC